MPTYVYEIINDDDTGGETFEVFQKMSDPPLTKHPDTDQPVRRVIVAPMISDNSKRDLLSNKNLDRLGFTKYENAGHGHFEKKSGGGPDVISAD